MKCNRYIACCVVGELHVAVVGSDKASARIVKVDPSAALAVPGVVGYLDHSSVPGSNKIGICGTCDLFAVKEARILFICVVINIIMIYVTGLLFLQLLAIELYPECDFNLFCDLITIN
jgi:xanthine dehydrogenase molybdopterin-binding subunit B